MLPATLKCRSTDFYEVSLGTASLVKQHQYSPPPSLIASVHFLGMAIGIIPGCLANKRVLLKPLTRVLSLLELSTSTPVLIHRPLFALCIDLKASRPGLQPLRIRDSCLRPTKSGASN
jgi:hypothetical protein